MRKNIVKHRDGTAHYAPTYSPAHFEVILDEGEREMKGYKYICKIIDIQSCDGLCRIIVSKS